MFECLAEDSAIEALTRQIFILGKNQLHRSLSHERRRSHFQKSGALLLQDTFLIFVELVHLVDENFISLFAFKLINVDALRNLID